jgi:hypothetical protein
MGSALISRFQKLCLEALLQAVLSSNKESKFSLDWSDLTDWWWKMGRKNFFKIHCNDLEHLMVESWGESTRLWQLKTGLAQVRNGMLLASLLLFR